MSDELEQVQHVQQQQGLVPRTKLHLADGRKVYLYGALTARPGLTAEQIAAAEKEPAGHYDYARNEVVMTEPTLVEEGVYHRDKK